MVVSLLFLVFSFCLASNDAEVAADRVVYAGSVGADLYQNKTCYLISARYRTTPTNAVGDIFAAAMGYNIAGFRFPWTAVGYVRGSASVKVDIDSYGNRSLDSVNVDAAGAVVAWAWTALGEFCDKDGVPGYQPGGLDYIYNYYYAPFYLYTQTCGATVDPVSGRPSYYASIQNVGGHFNTSCYVFPNDVFRRDRTVSRYHFKCDVNINYATLWDTNATRIAGCPDTQRKVGILLNVAGAAFDVDVRVSNLNSPTPNSENRISFGAGALAFAWDNYYYRSDTFGTITGLRAAVRATYLQTGQATYAGATRTEAIIFAFDTPKSANKNFYYWDPTTQIAASTSTVASLFMIMLALIALI